MDTSKGASFAEHLTEISRRTSAALERAGFDGVLVLAGSPPRQFGDDLPYPFKPNPWFKQWVPEPEPGCALCFRPGHPPRLIFLQETDFWHRPPELPAGDWARCFDIAVVHHAEEVPLQAPRTGRWALLGVPDPAWDGMGTWNPPALLRPLEWERAAKTPYEIECLHRASLRGVAAHLAAERAFRAGASEYEVHLEYCRAAALREEELPYNNIIAFNEHGAVLHYQRLERRAPPVRRSFLIDAGAPWAGYACDITRTHAAAPGPFADLIAGLDAAQQGLVRMIRPGVDYRDVHLEAHRRLGRLLAEAGVIRASPAEAVECGLTATFFPHGIGHLLGLQVHDVGGLMAGPEEGERPRPEGHALLRLTRELPERCVVTVEPGVYFIETLLAAAAADRRRTLIDWAAVEALRPCGGIRIEDNVVATQDGPLNLTRHAFAGHEAPP